MGRKRRAGFSPTRHDIEDAGRQARLDRQLRQPDDAEAGLGGGFCHDRISARQRGRDPARRQAQRVVPWNDLRRDTQRLAKREVDKARSQGKARAEDLVGDTGKVFEVARGSGDVVFRLAQGLADIEALQLGEFAAVLAEQAGDLVQEPNAAHRREPGPSSQGRLCRRHRRVDVGFVAEGHPRENLGCRRVDGLEASARSRRDPLAVEEHPAVDLGRLHLAKPTVAATELISAVPISPAFFYV